MNERIQVTDNWDGTQTVRLDGEIVLERRSPEECLEKAQYLDAYLAVKGLDT